MINYKYSLGTFIAFHCFHVDQDPLIIRVLERSAYRDRAGKGEHKNRFRVSNFGPGEPGLRLYNMPTCLDVGS